MLSRMVKVGDRIVDENGDKWTITDVSGGIAWYSKPTHEIYGDPNSKIVDCCFIAQFNENSHGHYTYNRLMTLEEDMPPEEV